MTPADNPLRRLPSVDRLLEDPTVKDLAHGMPRDILVDAVRRSLDATRKRLLEAPSAAVADDELNKQLIDELTAQLQLALAPHFRKAVNATGIILHTGLGRAVLPRRALDQIAEELTGYSVLQLSPDDGKRSRRDARIEWLLQQITGAQAATVVNNNSAATAIVLNTVAAGREVIVSRGQLVEIGGSFRLPDVMRTSGATMVEVGCTNKTHLRDYEQAITENTAAILRVHPSNYRVVGFSQEVELAPLVELARKHDIALIDDVGAGALVDMSRYGFAKEPTLPESIAAGADLTVSSADKLIGASQGGIILGRKDLVEKVRKNPWARIVRVGKLTLATLEATLTLFLDEQTALREVPTLQMVQRTLDELSEAADRLAEALARHTELTVEVIDGFSQMGSGSLPGQDVPTRLVALRHKTMSEEQLAGALRLQRPAVFARIRDGRVLIDPRTLCPGDDELLLDVVARVLDGK